MAMASLPRSVAEKKFFFPSHPFFLSSGDSSMSRFSSSLSSRYSSSSKYALKPGSLTTYVEGFSLEYSSDGHGGRYGTWVSLGYFWAKLYEYPGPTDKGRCYEVITRYSPHLSRAKRFLVGKLTLEAYTGVEEFMPNYGRFYVFLREDLKDLKTPKTSKKSPPSHEEEFLQSPSPQTQRDQQLPLKSEEKSFL